MIDSSSVRIYLDTETTGLDPKRDKIVEVALIAVGETREEKAAFSSLVYPGEALYARLLDSAARGFPVNAVPLKELQISDSSQTVAGELRNVLTRFPGATLFAYNAVFDRGFLAREPWASAFADLDLAWGECIMLAATEPGKRWPKLEATANRFSLEWDGTAHRALTDARMAAKVHGEILRRRKGNYGTVCEVGGGAI